MAVPPTVSVNLETQTTGWTKGLSSAGRDVKKFVGESERTFKSLTGQKGGAAFASALSGAAKGAEELATGLRTGANSGQLLGNIVNKIPIVGQFKQAGEAIRELITGEKAEMVILERRNDVLDKTIARYRQIANDQQKRGTYGNQRAEIEINQSTNANINKLAAERQALTKQLQEIESNDTGVGHLSGGHYSDEQKQQMLDLANQQKAIELQIVNERHNGDQAQKDRKLKEADEIAGRIHANDEAAIQFTDGAQEKLLRRSGRAIESAQYAIHAGADAAVRESQFAMREEAMKLLTPDQRATVIASENQKIAHIRQAEQTDAAEIAEIGARKKEEIGRDNEEHLTQIVTSGAIERLKITDEQENNANEISGNAHRSHLAEAATIEENYRKQIAEIKKKDREQTAAGEGDPANTAAQLAAAGVERQNQMGLQNQKNGIELAKNTWEGLKKNASEAIKASERENAAIKEKRRLWEEVGTPQEKYAAKLADINDEFAKLGDKGLKERQVQELDSKTLEEFKKQNPDHTPEVNLYGRTLGYGNIPTGNQSDTIAQRQLDEVKKANVAADQEAQDRKVMYDYYRKITNAVLQELNI